MSHPKTRSEEPGKGERYLHNMFSGSAMLEPLDNDRYLDIEWTPVGQVLAEYIHGKRAEESREESLKVGR